jgi:hypothetical protein
LKLEHSLASLSKWESEFEKPFLNDEDKTTEETLRYVEYMILNDDAPAGIVKKLTNEQIEQINAYITSKQTATTFNEGSESGLPGAKEIITAEIMYYWLVALNIPFEAQYWHLNRLITLVRVCNIKNDPKATKRKMSRREQIEERKRLNAERQAKYGTQG